MTNLHSLQLSLQAMKLDREVVQGLPVALPRSPLRSVFLAVYDPKRLRTGEGRRARDVAVVATDRRVRGEVRGWKRRR